MGPGLLPVEHAARVRIAGDLAARLEAVGPCLIFQGTGSERWVARRVAWELERTPLPERAQLGDTCGRDGCCRVSHLFIYISRIGSPTSPVTY